MASEHTKAELEKKIKDLQAQLEQKQLESHQQQILKMEAIGVLAGGISYDFNNLLMGIQGNVSIMQMTTDLESPHYKNLQRINKCLDSGINLTKQLMNLAKGGRYIVMPSDLNKILVRTSRMFSRNKKNINIHTTSDKDLWQVEVDRIQIGQVFLTLFEYASNAMPKGGNLFLQTENISLEDKFIETYKLRQSRFVKITITDTGEGLDKKDLDKVFEPFFKPHQFGNESHLDLASAYGVIRSHDGIITVNSEKGFGTIFNIYLPTPKIKSSEIFLNKKNKLHGETILLVDDEDLEIEVGRRLLEKLGYSVIIAVNGQDALKKYKTGKNEIALIILDMIMPDMDAEEVYAALHKINPKAKILLASGHSFDERINRLIKKGCSGFITKPFILNSLFDKITKALNQEK